MLGRVYWVIIAGFFLFMGSSTFAQTDSVEWAPIGATWYYNISFSSVFPHRNALKMESVKDTIVNEKSARLLEGTIYTPEGDTINALSRFPGGRIILHQQGDSIYYLRKNKFELLYDFSMQVGDTMRIVTPAPYPDFEYPQDTFMYLRVEETGTTEINGETLRTQTLEKVWLPDHKNNYGFGGEIIETIGTYGYFLPIDDLVCDAICPFPLRCYQDDNIFYKRVDIACDTAYLITSAESPIRSPDIRLYPNPLPAGHKSIHIEGSKLLDHSFEWIFRDVQGRVLYRGEEGIGRSTLRLPDGLAGGMYFLEIRQGQHRYIKKVVRQ